MQTGVLTNLIAKGGYLNVVLANLSAVGLSKWSLRGQKGLFNESLTNGSAKGSSQMSFDQSECKLKF